MCLPLLNPGSEPFSWRVRAGKPARGVDSIDSNSFPTVLPKPSAFRIQKSPAARRAIYRSGLVPLLLVVVVNLVVMTNTGVGRYGRPGKDSDPNNGEQYVSSDSHDFCTFGGRVRVRAAGLQSMQHDTK